MRRPKRWTGGFLVAVMAAAIAAHVFALGAAGSYFAVSAPVVVGVVVLAKVAHLGLLGPFSAWLRRLASAPVPWRTCRVAHRGGVDCHQNY